MNLPPLRGRRCDIRSRLNNPKRLSQDALRRLESHDWPANVRSLMNGIERAAISVRGEVIEARVIQLSEDESTRTPVAGPGLFPEPADQARRHLLRRASGMANGNRPSPPGCSGSRRSQSTTISEKTAQQDSRLSRR